MNPDNSAFKTLAFNLANLETFLLSEIVDPDENFFKECLPDLDTKYFSFEMLPDYFQNTNNKDFTFEYTNFAKTF